MLRYNRLSSEIEERILADRVAGWVNPYRCNDVDVLRRVVEKDKGSLLRPAYVRDIEKILHLPMYNRYTDKTQVFSFYNNDDITRRGLHVQLVSRVARNIGSLLGLNIDLIEAMALGHDIGHTPFGHAGEKYLSEILFSHTGKLFNHNVQSVRILDTVFQRNLSIQTLDGILCHNGEIECQCYKPDYEKGILDFDRDLEACCLSVSANKNVVPMTLEACVVRISDMIAYLGKDRQDAVTAGIIDENFKFSQSILGENNAQIINNLIVDIVENSYGKDHIELSPNAFLDLSQIKEENYKYIYLNDILKEKYDRYVEPMFERLYNRLLSDFEKGDEDTLIYKHHIDYIANATRYYNSRYDYLAEDPNIIVSDYIASMTDSYFMKLCEYYFGDEATDNWKGICVSYFE